MKEILAALSIIGTLGLVACDNSREKAEAEQAEGARTSTESAAEEVRNAAEEVKRKSVTANEADGADRPEDPDIQQTLDADPDEKPTPTSGQMPDR